MDFSAHAALALQWEIVARVFIAGILGAVAMGTGFIGSGLVFLRIGYGGGSISRNSS